MQKKQSRKKGTDISRISVIFTLAVLILFCVLILVTVLSGDVSARTIIVDDQGDWAEFNSIDDAIQEAADGDTIRVYEGEYYESIIVDKSLSIVGNGSATTIIDGLGNGSVVGVGAHGVNISGFHIRNSRDAWPYGGITNRDIGHCSNLTLMNNRISNTHYGIYISGADHALLKNNTCDGNTIFGISLHQVSSSMVEDNTCVNNEFGIRLWLSSGNKISNNSCWQNDIGIDLDNSRNKTLSENTCVDNLDDGIKIGTNEEMPNYSDNNVVANNTCTNNYIGISVMGSKRNVFYQNECNENDRSGIEMEYCESTEIVNNTCEDNGNSGIRLFQSGTIQIAGNQCNGNFFGINLMTMEESTITANTCVDNKNEGLRIEYSETIMIRNNTCRENRGSGMLITESNWLEIAGNTNAMNRGDGLEINYGNQILIVDNILADNIEDGIHLVSCDYVTIRNNSISYNDDGIYFRYWDDTEMMGNHNQIETNAMEGNRANISMDTARDDDQDDELGFLDEGPDEFVCCCCFLVVVVVGGIYWYVANRKKKRQRMRELGLGPGQYAYNMQARPAMPSAHAGPYQTMRMGQKGHQFSGQGISETNRYEVPPGYGERPTGSHGREGKLPFPDDWPVWSKEKEKISVNEEPHNESGKKEEDSEE